MLRRHFALRKICAEILPRHTTQRKATSAAVKGMTGQGVLGMMLLTSGNIGSGVKSMLMLLTGILTSHLGER